eukprot:186481_1
MALLHNDLQNTEDSDSGGPIQAQALPVNTDLEIDETQPASTAEEYLLRVRLQRQRLPKISSAQIDTRTLSKSQSLSKRNETSAKPIKKSKRFNNYNKYFQSTTNQCNASLLPRDTWKQKFIQSFERKRNILIHDIVSQSKWNKKNKNLRHTSYLQYKYLRIPSHSRGNEWLKFAFNCAQDGNENNCANDDEPYPIPPLLTIIEQLSPIETEKVLEMFMKFIMETHENDTENGLNGITSLWLYSLFLRVELPLRAGLTANIREFARFCIKIRNEWTDNDESSLIVFVNIFIVIIENVFKQPIT